MEFERDEGLLVGGCGSMRVCVRGVRVSFVCEGFDEGVFRVLSDSTLLSLAARCSRIGSHFPSDPPSLRIYLGFSMCLGFSWVVGLQSRVECLGFSVCLGFDWAVVFVIWVLGSGFELTVEGRGLGFG